MKTFFICLLSLGLIQSAIPCSRILWNDNGRSTYVGRNMDWFEDTKSNMWVLPRGVERKGMNAGNSLNWKSKYGSFVISAYDAMPVDGINEKKLAVHVLYLPETSFGKRDQSKPGLAVSLWPQYYLDNFSSVKEVVEEAKKGSFQLVMVEKPDIKKAGTIHLAIDDESGDSAIIEVIDGKMNVYHDRKFTVMTNQPTFPEQLKNLRKYKGLGGKLPLPGSHEPKDRFVRGAFYSQHLPKPQSEREAIAALMSLMRNVAAPFGLANPERPNVSTTMWRSITDLKDGILYYDNVMSPQIFWVDTKKFDYKETASVMKLDLINNYDLSKEVSGQFKKAKMFEFLMPLPEPIRYGKR